MRQRIRQVAPDARLPVPTIGTVGSGGGSSPAIQVDGTLAVCTDVGSYVAPGVSRINAVYIRCETPGTAGNTIVDIHLNGVTIFTVQANRPTLAWNDPDGVAKSGAPDVIMLAENDVLTVEIDQVATGAEDLVVVIDIDLVVGLVGPMGAMPAHDILDGVTHQDSVADAVTRGSIIVGNATPRWDELLKGAAGTVLTAGAADISWVAPAGIGNDKMRAYRAAAQLNIVHNVWTKVQLTDEDYDPGGDFDNVVNYDYTIPTTGYYHVTGKVHFYDAVVNKKYAVGIYVNDALLLFSYFHAIDTSSITPELTDIIYWAVGDRIELWCWHFAGVNTPDLAGGYAMNVLAIHRLS